MNKSNRDRYKHDSWSVKSTIDLVIDGLSNAIGIGRGLVIAGFIVGLFIAPLLSVAVFVGTWYWISYPDKAERHLRRLSQFARRAARRVSDAAFARNSAVRPSTHPPFDETPFDDEPAKQARRTGREPPPNPQVLKERFADIDERTKAIEAFVASEEYRLEKEFKSLKE